MGKGKINYAAHPLALEGKSFGKWTVLRRDNSIRCGWLCRCECGKEKVVMSCNLTSGKSLSCGCIRTAMIEERSYRHGASRRHAKTAEYIAWLAMLRRCSESASEDEKRWYRDRGIRVCERWLISFENFLDDMGKKPIGTSIDRIDNNGNYEPGNCRWATSEQQANNKSSSRLIEFDGETLTLSQWARKLGIAPSAMHERLAKWSVRKSLTTAKVMPNGSR